MKGLIFDKYGECFKCGSTVHRLKKYKTWHHVNYCDYFDCCVIKGNGFVRVKREVPSSDDRSKT